MPFLDFMHAYFRGEKLEALFWIVPAGLALVALGIVALRVERGGFAWGVAAPALLFGLVLAATGGVVAARTDGQVAALERAHAASPAEMARAELPRMRKVNADFRTYFAAFVALAAVGLFLVTALPAPWARGLGSTLLLVAAVGLLIDGFASRRAAGYTAAVEELAGR